MVEVRFFIGLEEHASRDLPMVPSVGDEVDLRTGRYKVTKVTWACSNPNIDPKVFIEIEKI